MADHLCRRRRLAHAIDDDPAEIGRAVKVGLTRRMKAAGSEPVILAHGAVGDAGVRVRYWLMKSEPDCFGIDHLGARPKRTEHWDGVRNYQARNFLRDDMKKGDLAFFYHSSCPAPGIAGIVKIVRAGYPDHTAWDPASEHFDPKSSPTKPVWYMVDVQLVRAFRHPVLLTTLRQQPALRHMPLLQRGNRLSILPVTEKEWNTILKLEPSA